MRTLLVVCTANVCRSPVVAQLFRRTLDGVADVDGCFWAVTSAGTADVVAEMDTHTVRAAHALGLDLEGHRRIRLDRRSLAELAPDLVVAMAREHVRFVATTSPELWPRTFTLKELARRASAVPPPQTFADWRGRLSANRRAADLMSADPSDDVADPYGGARRAYEVMVAEVAALTDVVLRHGPWPSLRQRVV